MKKILSFLLLLSLCLAFPDSVMAKETTYDYETVIDMVAEEYIGKTIPGASIIISEHGDIVFAKGYGYADIEQQIPIEPSSTVFEWGSITKTFVWVSVMQQVELGHIDLSQDIHTYLSDGFLKNIQYETPITMLHLMNHTAGFAEQLFDLRYQENDMEQSLEDVLSINQPEQVFEPGTVSAYSNWGAALAALIVERVSGQDFAEYVHEHILSPLSMSQTAVRPQWNDCSAIIEKKATGYSFSAYNETFQVEDWMRFRMYPAGSMNGTSLDLMKYANELAKMPDTSSILFQDAQTKNLMFSETYCSFGANAGLSHGFWQYPNNSGILGHEGGTYGFKSQFWVEPENERAIVILTNVMETGFCSKIMEALVQQSTIQPSTLISPKEKLCDFEGDYLPARSSWGNVAEIQGHMQTIQISAIADGQLLLKMPFMGKEQIYEQTDQYQFYCADAIPEEQVIAFSIKDGDISTMSFRLAHDYIPADAVTGVTGTILCVGIYVLCIFYWVTVLCIRIGRRLFKKVRLSIKMEISSLCGLFLGASGIIGLSQWISNYTVRSTQLNCIVGFNWIIGLAGILLCVLTLIKDKFRHAKIMLIVFMIQFVSTYQMGFLTFNWK